MNVAHARPPTTGWPGLASRERTAAPGIYLRGDRIPYWFQFFVGCRIAARHQRWPKAGARLAARTPEPMNAALLPQSFLPTNRVGPFRVAAVDDDVSGSKQRREAIDHRIGRHAGLDQQDDLAGTGERLHELRQRCGANDSPGGVGILRNKLRGFPRWSGYRLRSEIRGPRYEGQVLPPSQPDR